MGLSWSPKYESFEAPEGGASLRPANSESFQPAPCPSTPGPGLWCLGEAGRGPSELPGALFGP